MIEEEKNVEKKSNKKRIITTIGAMALVGALGVFGTLAYLNNVTETKTNVFTSSKDVDTELTEKKWDEEGKKQAENYYPGEVIKKNPVMTNTSDSSTKIWTGVKLDFVKYDDNNNAQYMNYDEFKEYASMIAGDELDVANEGWIQLGTYDNGSQLWMFDKSLAQNESTNAIFDGVKVYTGIKEVITDTSKTYHKQIIDADGTVAYEEVTAGEMTSEKKYYEKQADGSFKEIDAFELPRFEIKVTGYAIQEDGIDLNTAKVELAKLAELN